MWIRKRHANYPDRFAKWHVRLQYEDRVARTVMECGYRMSASKVAESSKTTPPKVECCQICWRHIVADATAMSTGV